MPAVARPGTSRVSSFLDLYHHPIILNPSKEDMSLSTSPVTPTCLKLFPSSHHLAELFGNRASSNDPTRLF